jgi:hypothetical protein
MKIRNANHTSNTPLKLGICVPLIIGLGVGFVSSRLDGFMFYLLAAGLIVLAVLIASAVLDMILTGLAWRCGRQRERTPAAADVSYSSFQERTSGSREIAMVKPLS